MMWKNGNQKKCKNTCNHRNIKFVKNKVPNEEENTILIKTE